MLRTLLPRPRCLPSIILKRNLNGTSSQDELPPLVTPDLSKFSTFLKDVESKWQMKLMRRFDRERYVGDKEEKLGESPPRYILSMFPYPSGRLHLGHVRIYTSADLLTRYSRQLCKNDRYSTNYKHVINPMGFDSFGLPAENAARERGLNPAVWTNSNIRTMKQQLDDLSIQFDWREATSNPSFYKWTQDLFLKLMKAGLVYKSYAQVNWDPVDKTVLADEQVDEEGRSWRSGALVETKNLRQWFVKVNSFTNDIYTAQDVDQETWGDILTIQRNWIGKPNGWLFYLPVGQNSTNILPLFTKHPELFLKDGTQILLAANHWLEKVYNVSKLGYVENPFTGSKLKVVLTDVMDELPSSCNVTLVNSAEELEDQSSREQVLLRAREKNLGGYYTSDKYRDWLISRQRFWGTPIPAVECQNCGHVGVVEDSLPVRLPNVKDFSNTRESKDEYDSSTVKPPLEQLAPTEWIETNCPSCGGKAKRDCETLDTLFDSSWYFLRYATSPPSDKPFDPQRVQPVWCYIGGKEHASMHLFYARFMTHFLHSQGLLKFKEPFEKLLVQGVVKSKTYKLNGRYLSREELETLEDNSNLTVDYEKMSKSKGNGVDPQDLLNEYGVDATRLCLMSYANPKTERLWRSTREEFKDVLVFLRRLTLTIQEYTDVGRALLLRKENLKIQELTEQELEAKKASLVEVRNASTIDATYHIQETNQFRQYISALHVLLGEIRSHAKTSALYTEEFAEATAALLVMMNPLTPHLAEELWLHFSRSVINPLARLPDSPYKTNLQASDQPWPVSDDNYPLLIKIRGINSDNYAEKIPVTKDRFKSLSLDDITALVESHFSAAADKCKVLQVKKYDDFMAIVTANIDSVNQKMNEKKKKRRKETKV